MKKDDHVLKIFDDHVRSPLRDALPNCLVEKIRKFRRRAVLKAYAEVGIIFFHVPRTAGTSIASALYDMQINHFPVSEMAPLMQGLLGLPRFAIVRNPWDRAVSAWNFARCGGGRDNLVQVRNRYQYQLSTFQTFDRFVHDWLPYRDLNRVDGMFKPQMHFLADAEGQLHLDHLGRFEDLAATLRWLSGHVPKVLEIRHLNATDRAPYREHYTASSRDVIAQIYAQDIERFGYDF